MSNTPQLQWRLLVTPGHVWQARLNAITWLGVVLLALFAVWSYSALLCCRPNGDIFTTLRYGA